MRATDDEDEEEGRGRRGRMGRRVEERRKRERKGKGRLNTSQPTPTLPAEQRASPTPSTPKGFCATDIRNRIELLRAFILETRIHIGDEAATGNRTSSDVGEDEGERLQDGCGYPLEERRYCSSSSVLASAPLSPSYPNRQ